MAVIIVRTPLPHPSPVLKGSHLPLGPIFSREFSVLPRRGRTYTARAAYAGGALVLMCTAWQVVAGVQSVRSIGDFARFGTMFFQLLAPLQLLIAVFYAALSAASLVAAEKERRTFDLLLLTRLSNTQLVLGKSAAGLLSVVNLAPAAVPVTAMTALWGGYGFRQIADVVLVTASAVLTAGCLGTTIALWREKTYQTLAVIALTLVGWTLFWEVVDRGTLGAECGGIAADAWAVAASPWHAVLSIVRSASIDDFQFGPFRTPTAVHATCSLLITAALTATAVAGVRRWNPSREVQLRNLETLAAAPTHHWSLTAVRAATTPAVAARGLRRSRPVWSNPILWREIMTWAYGRRVIAVRLIYSAICAACWWGLAQLDADHRPTPTEVALPVLPAFVLGALLLNMQAVTSITSERDARAFDLLLATDLTPREFIFGKLAGVLYNAKESLLLPAVLCFEPYRLGAAGAESTAYLIFGWWTAAVLVAMIGIHVGMHYAESRAATAVSLGTVFFLIVGVAVGMRLMIAFSGSFQAQLQPFLATILGGGIGLYAALGRRNPSPAVAVASFLLPAAVFYALTSFLLEAHLAALIAVVGSCGFATAALLVPALFEFDVATGRATDGVE